MTDSALANLGHDPERAIRCWRSLGLGRSMSADWISSHHVDWNQRVAVASTSRFNASRRIQRNPISSNLSWRPVL